MVALDIGQEAQQAITLIKSFSLELDEYGPESQVLYWLSKYRAAWIRDAIIEAIYQGRYKIISVQHILSIWQRRGQPLRHFTSGFEQALITQHGVTSHLSKSLSPIAIELQPGGASGTMDDQDVLSWSMTTAPSPAVTKIMAESSVLSRTDDSDWSIEAFPVAAFDTLVAVYQASGAGYAMAQPIEPSDFQGLRFELPSEPGDILDPNHGPTIASVPIQPFRPRPRKHYA
ncbi:hypothetical protein [Leptothoe sp. PORK10 BA2]|uniref:hypothetical protein n=1 Tax=Leptothoe sp. PORK10 BA2 TaxID=3110254 RepID=UPI002B21CCC2|nr:hypothetical protein [Leptothoe sp. PORK10 BA2]MEA5462969.1 hypothetical protein [Leptothoe sp. PORK10 BA2]